MALCDECECYDDNWVDGEDITEEELEKDPLYEPHRYYYWHGDIQEDYQMPAGYECLCERCFGDLLGEGKIIENMNGKPTNLILIGMMQKWAGLCHLNNCPLSVAFV